MNDIAAEAADWKREKAKEAKHDDAGHFYIEEHNGAWRLLIFPNKGQSRVITGLTYPEAHRQRLPLSKKGYVGKVIGHWSEI